VVDPHSSYQLAENVELFTIIQNMFNNNYATFRIFGDVTKTPLPGAPNPTDPRFITVAAPLAVFGGVRVRF
jgi:iron complex outermembrane receptor protein